MDIIDKWDYNWILENKEEVYTYDEFLKNMEPVKNIITPIKAFSKDVVDKYEDETIDFIFIDADHEYDGVIQDIKIWYPKVKKGGVIAGHDYTEYFSGVIKAVKEYFGEDYDINRTSWIHYKK